MREPVRDSSGRPVFAYRPPPGARAKRTRPNDNPEERLQMQVLEYLRFALPADYRFTFSGAGVKTSAFVAIKLKNMGVEKGWPDLTIKNRRTGACRWIELKSPTGRLTPEQAEFIAECPATTAVCRSPADVEAALIGWGIKPLRPLARANRYAT
jgi:hypothetical protein